MNSVLKLKKTSQVTLLWFIITIQSVFMPLSLYAPNLRAQEITENLSEPVATSEGPQQPTGPEKSTYIYNEETGLWENDYYTWNPNTKLTSPKTEKDYSYNPETEMWDTKEWIYAPEKGSYKEQTVSTQSTPQVVQKNQQNTNNDPYDTQKTNTKPVNPVIADSLNTANESLKKPASDPVNENTTSLLNNPDSINKSKPLSVSSNSISSGYFDNFFDADISVSVKSNAKTGDASILQNTKAGSAFTGDASSIASIMNLINSTWGIGGLMPELYTENIQGDYFGDILLDPSQLKVSNSSSKDLVVNSESDVKIVNNVDLNAESGNALVKSNTEAGDATSGDATAILNLMNVINSSIATGQSFLGMLNIFGNLEGDVLLPDNLIDSLIASNVPTANIGLSAEANTVLDIDNDVKQAINNDILATAASGNAEVSNNTKSGSATSGDATTDITVFNLVGNRLVADQAILVFVNVQGKWIGFITDAPAGTNVALLGGGVSTNKKNLNASFDIDTDSLIQNNVNLSATTGDASVLNNTEAGNATTGDASVVANITNISNSSFSLSNWFGMLFINVFGDWSGSFGTNTPFGSIIAASTTSNNNFNELTTAVHSQNNVKNTGAEPVVEDVRIYAVTLDGNSSGGTSVTSATPETEEDVPPPAVLASAFESDSNNIVGSVNQSSDSSGTGGISFSEFYNNSAFVAFIVSVLLAGLFLRNRYVA